MKVIYKNIEVEVENNITALDFLKETLEEKTNVIACVINNEVRPLNYKLKENDEIELLDTTQRDGRT